MKNKKQETKFEANTKTPALDDYERGYFDFNLGRCVYTKIGNHVHLIYTVKLDTRKPITTLPFPNFDDKPGKIIEVKKRRKKK